MYAYCMTQGVDACASSPVGGGSVTGISCTCISRASHALPHAPEQERCLQSPLSQLAHGRQALSLPSPAAFSSERRGTSVRPPSLWHLWHFGGMCRLRPATAVTSQSHYPTCKTRGGSARLWAPEERRRHPRRCHQPPAGSPRAQRQRRGRRRQRERSAAREGRQGTPRPRSCPPSGSRAEDGGRRRGRGGRPRRLCLLTPPRPGLPRGRSSLSRAAPRPLPLPPAPRCLPWLCRPPASSAAPRPPWPLRGETRACG